MRHMKGDILRGFTHLNVLKELRSECEDCWMGMWTANGCCFVCVPKPIIGNKSIRVINARFKAATMTQIIRKLNSRSLI